MEIIDTHSHIYLEEFDADRQEVVSRAKAVGVTHMLMPSVDMSSSERLNKTLADWPNLCFAMIGLHPTSVNANYEAEMKYVESELERKSQYIAVGEIGLDMYWDRTFEKEQAEVLRRQILLAQKYEKPIVIHLRSAKEPKTYTDDANEVFLKLLTELKTEGCKTQGMLHCYSGNVVQAKRAVEEGLFIGVGGVVTYKRSQLQEVVAAVPMENIVVETDAPYLAPIPYRGHRNESAYIVEVVKKIAEIKGVTAEVVSRITTENAKRLFRLK